MNTSAKLFVAAVCLSGVVTVVSIAMSRPHRSSHGDVDATVRIIPLEPLLAEQRHDHGSKRLAQQAAPTLLKPVAVDADSKNPDTLEDSDEIRAWARMNPRRAQEWLASALQGTKRDVVSEMVCSEIAETNPAAAAILADGYGAGCTNILENLMAQWAGQDMQAAYGWAAARPAGTQRDSLLSRIAFVESKTDPQDAATLVAQQIASGQIQDEAAVSVLHQWAQKDSAAAMRWAQSFSAGTLHDRAVNEVQNVIASNSQSENAH
jgi:hypothetical protein